MLTLFEIIVLCFNLCCNVFWLITIVRFIPAPEISTTEGNKYVSIIDNFNTYLLLTEFEVRTVSYGPSFFPVDYGSSAKRAGHKSLGKKRGSVSYGADREDEVRKIFIISLLCVWRVRQRFPFVRNGFKFLNQVENKTNQFEIVFKSLARFSTPLRIKENRTV